MADSGGDSPGGEQKKKKAKSGKRWLRDVLMFGAGFVSGGGTVLGIGIATDRVSPDELLPGGKSDDAADDESAAA